MVMHQFDYIFAIGTIFAFLDAWNIGALLLIGIPLPIEPWSVLTFWSRDI